MSGFLNDVYTNGIDWILTEGYFRRTLCDMQKNTPVYSSVLETYTLEFRTNEGDIGESKQNIPKRNSLATELCIR